MKRTNVDFSKHELKVTELDGVLIHEFKQPNTTVCKLVFINTHGVMTVTGDFGNWVFCREFHPSADNSVSDFYFDEKLIINSSQKAYEYDPKQTSKNIKAFKETFSYYFGRRMNDEEVEWVEELEENVWDEFDYTYLIHRKRPTDVDFEDCPLSEKRHRWLDAVYDGFDAICEVLRKEEKKETYKKDLKEAEKDMAYVLQKQYLTKQLGGESSPRTEKATQASLEQIIEHRKKTNKKLKELEDDNKRT